jgi:hypothetical protein
MINWYYYPLCDEPTETVRKIVSVFENVSSEIDSSTHDVQVSNLVLEKVATHLQQIGFQVETGKRQNQKIRVPVLFGLNGKVSKSFDADAYHPDEGFVIEIEAGRAVTNYQFLKDLFQACMMHDVSYLAIAVRNLYRISNDFEKVHSFFDTLYASNRLTLPLKGILIIGY